MTQSDQDLREKVARLVGSYVVYDDKGGPDTLVLADVIGGDYGESTRRVYELTDSILSLLGEVGEGVRASRTDPSAAVCPGRPEAQRSAGWSDDWDAAPYDGSFVLGCQLPDEPVKGWHKSWEQWKAPVTISYRAFHPNAPGKEQWRDAKGSPVHCTHWQPLPEPPEGAE